MRSASPRRRNMCMRVCGIRTFRVIDGLSIRFVESDPRSADALLLSPWPESVMAYEPTWARLAEKAHLVAIDLPGFGRSDRRDTLMSPRAMSEFILRAADAFGLDHAHIVGPDIGTPAAPQDSNAISLSIQSRQIILSENH